MTTRIEKTFERLRTEGRAAHVSYVMGCDPDMDTSLEIFKGLPGAGTDIIELGMPFSDNTAEGPTIQEASIRALKAGATTQKIFEMIKAFRKEDKDTPVILMGYYNPVYHYGIEAFVEDAITAGADGMIIVDLPPEEEMEFVEIAAPKDFSLIKLTTPTTDKERAKTILKNASGWVYYVSIAGITGTKSGVITDIQTSVQMLKEVTDLPIGIGFGIKTKEQVKEMSTIADAVIVGSAFVKVIEEYLSEKTIIAEKVLEKVRSLFT